MIKDKEKRNAYFREYLKKYRQEHKDCDKTKKERNKRYTEKHKEELKEYRKQYYKTNREKLNEKRVNYYYTNKNNRANSLLYCYRRDDKKYGRGECTLTAEWIVENIFSEQKCIYCGESDWTKLGCDRINNDLPHTPSNVVCSCGKCNCKRHTKKIEDFII